MNLHEDELQALLAPLLEQSGYQLWGVEVVPQHYPLLRIYVEGAQDAITIGQIGQVSQQVIDSLRLSGVDTQTIHLEVSSPGLNRRLFTLAQCELFVGQVIAVKLRQAFLGRQRYKGMLMAVKDAHLIIKPPDMEVVECPWSLVTKANVVADLQSILTSEKKGKRS